MEFKNVLYKLRTDQGLSQAALAKALGMSTGLIGMYESGKRMPSVEAQEILADYFNVSLDYLMGRDSGSMYYLNPDTAKAAQEIFENKKLRVLFDAARNAKPEDLETATDVLKALLAKERGGSED